MPFLNDIVARIDTDQATLLEPLVYQGKTDQFTVPIGARTDFASVPRALTWLVPKMGIWTKGAVLHDNLCDGLEQRYRLRACGVRALRAAGWVELEGRGWTPPGPAPSAREVDKILRRVMRELGVGVVTRWLVWTAVRWGALADPWRRPGWILDAPTVLVVSLLALPVLLPATVPVLIGLLFYSLAEGLARLV